MNELPYNEKVSIPHIIGRSASGLYPCLWRTCLKYRTDKQFTTPNKLLQHIRAKHAYSKSARKIISLSERNRFHSLLEFELNILLQKQK